MDKFKEIRPIALGLAIKDNKVLVSEGYDKVKDQTFYRCLGGGIEFLEKSDEALKREFKEEIGADITVKDFLGLEENIFTFNGKDGHEIIFVYSVHIKDCDFKNKYTIVDEVDSVAVWMDIEQFKSGKEIIYPSTVIKYL